MLEHTFSPEEAPDPSQESPAPDTGEHLSTFDIEFAKLPTIDIDDEYGGKVFRPDGITITEEYSEPMHPAMRTIMSRVGFLFDDYGVPYYPDSIRLAAACEANDIPIVLEEDSGGLYGAISPTKYSEDVDGGRHPVGIGGKVAFYLHDIKDDHMPAVSLLGHDLFDFFSDAAHKDLEPIIRARMYDAFTENVRKAIEGLLGIDKGYNFQSMMRVCMTDLYGNASSDNTLREESAERLTGLINDNLERLGIDIDRPAPALVPNK